MRALARALDQGGDPVPFPWEIGITPRRGQLVSLVAAPGVGKSLVGLAWAVHLAEQGRPSLVISIDTDLPSQAQRAVAMVANLPIKDVEDDPAGYAEVLLELDYPIRWSDSAMTGEDLDELLAAEAEYLGEVPALVVVDVATSLLDGEENAGNVRGIFRRMQAAARKHQTVVFALHHLSAGDNAKGAPPQAMSVVTMKHVLYKVEGIPEILLGAWRPGPKDLRIAVLKNRQGNASPDGTFHTRLECDLPRAQIRAKF